MIKLIMRFLLSVVVVVSLSENLTANSVVIRGKTKDANSYREISNVNIYIKDSQIGTISGAAGDFTLIIPENLATAVLVFRHIAYDSLSVSIVDLKENSTVLLQPRIIELREVAVEASHTRSDLEKDLPQTVSIFDANTFEIRGFEDAGDLLRTDHSIQIEEEISGKKTIAMRGGNADEVIVLYNGIRMNNTFDNVFDLSQVDLNDVERLEIVKGSNTVIYGSEALSGVINIIPKIEKNYSIRFHQRFGTYNAGDWAVNLHQRLGESHGSYSYKEGKSKRVSSSSDDLPDDYLVNRFKHQSANLLVPLGKNSSSQNLNTFTANYINSNLEFDDQRDNESLATHSRMAVMRYRGNLWRAEDFSLAFSLQQRETKQAFITFPDTLRRNFIDETSSINLEKGFTLKRFGLRLAYNYEVDQLDYADLLGIYTAGYSGLKSSLFTRNRNGLIAILKLTDSENEISDNGSGIHFSYRRDLVEDRQDDAELYSTIYLDPDSAGYFNTNKWDESVIKLSSNFSREYLNSTYSFFLNYGNNVKFPTLFQQISAPQSQYSPITKPQLTPEKNTSFEIGAAALGQTPNSAPIYGWEAAASVFRTYYHNKFRTHSYIGIPIVYYDNVQNVKISGIESTGILYLYNKKLKLEGSVSRYFISEKAAFPFKSEINSTINLQINHRGYSFMVYWFSEGEQRGWIRLDDSSFNTEVVLPKYSNIDLHFSKTIEFKYLKFFLNGSARNILNDDTELMGFALRDRRYYITLGVEL